MKYEFVKFCGSSKLVAFFGGFASDAKILSQTRLPPGVDVAVFYDYRDLECGFDFSKYSSVCVVAWSFGVRVADMALGNIPVKVKIAVNGSLYPIDASRGIPPEIFVKTSENFSEENKSKFYRRICGGSAAFERNSPLLCARSAADLKLELETLGAEFSSNPAEENSPAGWDFAIASKSDRIFSIENMRAAWGGKLRETEGAHLNLPAFDMAFEMLGLSIGGVGKAFEKNLDAYDDCAFVQREICSQLAMDIKGAAGRDFLRSVSSVFEIGCGTGILTMELDGMLHSPQWHLNDLTEKICARAAKKLGGHPSIIAGDIMQVGIPKNLDMVVSSSCFQWVGDLRKLFGKINASMSPGGILAFSTFGNKNYIQIRSLLGKGLEYSRLEEITEALEKSGFCVLHAAEDLRLAEFKSPSDVLRHIKSTGVNGGFSEFWTPSKLRGFSARYRSAYPSENGVVLTYNPIRIIAKKKS